MHIALVSGHLISPVLYMHSAGQWSSNFASQLTICIALVIALDCLHSLNEYYLKLMHSICDTVLITSDEIPRDLLRDRKIIRFRVIIRFGLTAGRGQGS